MPIFIKGAQVMDVLNVFEAAEHVLNMASKVHFSLSQKLSKQLAMVSYNGAIPDIRTAILKDIDIQLEKRLEQRPNEECRVVVYDYYAERLKLFDKDKDNFTDLLLYPIESSEKFTVYNYVYDYAYDDVSPNVYQDQVNIYVPFGITKEEEQTILKAKINEIQQGKTYFNVSFFAPVFRVTNYYLKGRNGRFYKVVEKI